MTFTKRRHITANILLITALIALAFAASVFASQAISGLESNGVVKVSSTTLRSKTSFLTGKKKAILKKGARVEIKYEVFTSKTNASSRKKWYYVNTAAGKGYVRCDKIKIKKYAKASGKATENLVCRAGAGDKMKKKRNIAKNKKFTVVMQAKASGSSAVWFKIKKKGKYYYVSSKTIQLSNITSGLPSSSADIQPAAAIVQSSAALKVVKGACKWAKIIAADNDFHYGYTNKSKSINAHHNGCYFCNTQMLKGGKSKKGITMYETTYCCNPFVHAAYAHGGNEKTMLAVCQSGTSYDYHKNRGYDVSSLFVKLGHPRMSLLKKGDVLCTDTHVMLYVGGGKVSEAAFGDDNVPYSDRWNESIRTITLSSSRYKNIKRVYRYIGNDAPIVK